MRSCVINEAAFNHRLGYRLRSFIGIETVCHGTALCFVFRLFFRLHSVLVSLCDCAVLSRFKTLVLVIGQFLCRCTPEVHSLLQHCQKISREGGDLPGRCKWKACDNTFFLFQKKPSQKTGEHIPTFPCFYMWRNNPTMRMYMQSFANPRLPLTTDWDITWQNTIWFLQQQGPCTELIS